MVETFLLASIRWRESGGNYTSPPKDPPYATASGAYQFIESTWQYATARTGVGMQYGFAYEAPPAIQDTNALWLLRTYGPNSSHSWQSSGPYPGAAEVEYALMAAVHNLEHNSL